MSASLMGRVIRFRGGRHREVADLLPWRLSGQLDAAEVERVEAHLKVCAECRAEVRFQENLGAEIARLPLDVEQGWARMLQKIEADAAARPRARPAARPKPRTWGPIPARVPARAAALAWRTAPVWSGWAMAASLLVVATVWVTGPRPDSGAFRALNAKTAAAPADLVVIFRPETPERELRAALRDSHARLVGGPTEADAYLLSTPLADRAQALAALRRRPDVVLAEPLDPSPAP